MRLAAIADIHGNRAALAAVLKDIAKHGVELTVNLGDCVSGPLQPRETAALLITRNFPTVAGNHERQLLGPDLATMGASDRYAREMLTADQLGWLASLPATLLVADDVLLCHGTPSSDMIYLLETVESQGRRAATVAEVEERLAADRCNLVLCGHSHTPRMLRLPDGSLIANPGSVGLQAFEWDQPYPHKVASGTPQARYGLFERTGGTWNGKVIAVDYPSDDVAQMARRNGASDWFEWLASGQA